MNTNSEGKCRTDTTGRVGDKGNDEGYCGVVTGNPDIHSCKVNPEGAGLDACDYQFWQSKCPQWFYSVDGGFHWKRCLPDGDGATQEFSCDHFDDYTDTEGPYIGSCDLGPSGGPISGYHMVPHGIGKVRACKADESVCSDPLSINF